MTRTVVDISVVVVSYKVRERLRSCLDSLRQSDNGGLAVEVIVVDNASDDGTVDILAPLYPEVTFLPMDRNLGFSMACNRGAARSSGHFILFLNPDTVVYPDTLAMIHRFASEHPEAGIVGCRIIDGEGRLQLACRRSIPTVGVALARLSGLSLLFPRNRVLGRYNLTYLDPAGSYPVEAVSGSFLLISRAAYDDVGGFDEDYFLYAEDLDLCLKVARSGRQIWYCGETSIVHHKGQSAASRPWGARMDFYRAMVIFSRKNLGVGPVLEKVLHLVAAILATGNVLTYQLRNVRSLFLDVLTLNGVFLVVALLWLGVGGIFPYVASPLGWIWHLVLTVSIIAGQTAVGGYRRNRVDVPRRVLAMGLSLGVFLSVGLVFKQHVFSRAVFVLGGGAAGMALLWLHARTRSETVPMRVVVAGTGEHSIRLARVLRAQGRVRVVGLMALAGEGLALDSEFIAVIRSPCTGPAVKALDIQGLVFPGDDPDVAGKLVRTAGALRHGLKLYLALMPDGSENPALVDITLDRSLIPERKA